LRLRGGAFLIELEQALKHVFVGKVGGPAISRRDRFIEFAMRVLEPSGTLVV
jgi:hypothetical protein